MELFTFCLHLILLHNFAADFFVLAQDQSDFISMDCGIPDSSSYNDEKTEIKYVSDANFISTGVSKSISSDFQTSMINQQLHTVRSFPEGIRNCYSLNPTKGKGNKYLIRATFMYGNYDGLGRSPEFDLYLEASLWDSIKLDNESFIVTKEIIYLAQSDNIFLCLVNKGTGTPFISVLELRFLKNSSYESPYETLDLYRRLDLASSTNTSIRYKSDIYDRIWNPKHFASCRQLKTSLSINPDNENPFTPASIVMSSAATPINASKALVFYLEPEDPEAKYFVFMHFAEVEDLRRNQTREFIIFVNEEQMYSPLSPKYLLAYTLYNKEPYSGSKIKFSLQKTDKSTLPPIINALEIYTVKEFLQSRTNEVDAEAIMSIKSKYGVERLWQGDPCTPSSYPWDGLNCSYEDNYHPRITSLNLSSSGLAGEIALHFSNLTMLQYLDLSNNSLSGTVPAFLSEMQFLQILNLEGNKLTGSLPAELLKKSSSGSLSLRVRGNLDLCLSTNPCKKKDNKLLIPLIVSATLLLIILTALALLWNLMKKKSKVGGTTKEDIALNVNNGHPLDSRCQYYTYSDIINVTNNFEKILGRGGFGSVYFGYLECTQVAVKMLSSSSSQGYKEFHAEVQLLMRVHHRNLTGLIGYCNEGGHLGLIYEYMANGNLGQYLSGRNPHILSWEDRLNVAADAAEGLAYLHHGCTPPIVHRDVKSCNILLNESFRAKLADFGLSRGCATESRTHISTAVAGTPGYLAPECYITNRLNEKSDVYSFGVVLLEIITGRPVISRNHSENIHVIDWVTSFFVKGDIEAIIDAKLEGKFHLSSAWKITELALACTSEAASGRPAMSRLTVALKECVESEVAQMRHGHES